MYGSGRIRISYRSGGKPDKRHGAGRIAYRGRRGEGGHSQSPFPRLIHFLLLIRLFREIASDKLDELDDDDKDKDGSHHDVGLETLVAVADGEVA